MRSENLLGDPRLVKDRLEYVEKIGRFNVVSLLEKEINRVPSEGKSEELD
jgi:hypothetical protein